MTQPAEGVEYKVGEGAQEPVKPQSDFVSGADLKAMEKSKDERYSALERSSRATIGELQASLTSLRIEITDLQEVGEDPQALADRRAERKYQDKLDSVTREANQKLLDGARNTAMNLYKVPQEVLAGAVNEDQLRAMVAEWRMENPTIAAAPAAPAAPAEPVAPVGDKQLVGSGPEGLTPGKGKEATSTGDLIANEVSRAFDQAEKAHKEA
jgi:hypothetical protein